MYHPLHTVLSEYILKKISSHHLSFGYPILVLVEDIKSLWNT